MLWRFRDDREVLQKMARRVLRRAGISEFRVEYGKLKARIKKKIRINRRRENV